MLPIIEVYNAWDKLDDAMRQWLTAEIEKEKRAQAEDIGRRLLSARLKAILKNI